MASNERPLLANDEIEEISGWFDFFDKNNDHKLDFDEFKKVCAALCWNVTDEELENEMKKFDIDRNGYIDFDEYMSFVASFRKDPDTERLELREAFRHFNRDRSGTMEIHQLRRYLLSLGIAFNTREERALNRMISQADQNGDGKIDIDEYVDLMMEKLDFRALQMQSM